jgi:hypothetical protein
MLLGFISLGVEANPEQLFKLDKIKSFQLLDEYFTKPGPNYKKDDSAMKVIYCQL